MLAVAIRFLFAADGRPSPSRNTGGSYISPGHRTTGLDVPKLVPVVCQLFEAGLAVSSLKSYIQVGKRRYAQFCTEVSLCPYPASEAVLCQFVARLAWRVEQLSHT